MRFTIAPKRAIVNNTRLNGGYTLNQSINSTNTTNTKKSTQNITAVQNTIRLNMTTQNITTLWTMRDSMRSCKQPKARCSACGH